MVAIEHLRLSSYVFVVFVFFSTTDVQFTGASGLHERLLINKIALTDANVRPVSNSLDSVNVTLDITFHGVINMDEKYQILSSSVWVRQEWTNQLVTWNPEDYGGLKHVTIDSSLTWQPDIVLYNNAFEEFDGRMDSVKTRIRVHNDGYCYWAAPFVFKTSCHFDVRDFPYDEQVCKLKFGSWLFHSRQLDLFRKKENAPVAKDKVDNGEWKITSIKTEKNVIKYDCCPDELYPDITFVINLDRRSLFYTYNLIIPNFIIAVLAFFSFYIPVECGERLSIVITVVLSKTVFLLLVAESVPPTSEAVPVIGMFFTCSIIEVSLALIATGISLKVYYSYLYERGLSPGLRKFLFYRVAPILCVETNITGHSDHCKNKWRVGNPFGFLKKLTERAKCDNDVSITENKGRDPDETQTNSQTNGVRLLSFKTISESDIGIINSRQKLEENELIKRNSKRNPLMSELEMITSAVKDHKETEKRAAESGIAAAIVDKAFMVLFSIVFLASSFIILLLPHMK